jgi:hypothetical protein
MMIAETAQTLTPSYAASADGADLGNHENSEVARWLPRWLVDVGHGCELGITTDDGCFVVLYPHEDNAWQPGRHIPKPVAERMAQLAASGVFD